MWAVAYASQRETVVLLSDCCPESRVKVECNDINALYIAARYSQTDCM
jgi:hypothetical protein